MTLVSLSLMFIILLGVFIINSRTPFYTYKKGGWSIGFQFSKKLPNSIDPNKGNIFSIDSLKKYEPNTNFLADPFFIKKDDTTYILFEYARNNKRGADIALLKTTDGENMIFDTIILDEPFHLSYPQVFFHRNEYYMIPESKRANNVLLYKSHNFPYDWKIEDTLIKNVRLKDPSIFISDTLNFLVASDDATNLYFYKSDSLFGNWKLDDEVLRYGTEARPAGRIFTDEKNNIVVPIQNCSEGYGYGVSLYNLTLDENKLPKLSLQKNFFLKASETIDEFSAGMHHIDIQKDGEDYFFVYDGNFSHEEKIFNWKFPLKASYLDLKNYFHQHFK